MNFGFIIRLYFFHQVVVDLVYSVLVHHFEAENKTGVSSELVQRNKRRLSGKVKGDIGTMNCPLCDWRIHSPFGRDYLVEHLMIHVENHCPEMIEKKATKN